MCGSDAMERHLLGRRGTLWTFTTQGYLPKEPYTGPETDETFAGYGLGYVELPGEVIVESRLTERDPTRLAIGQPMELVIVPFRMRCRRNGRPHVRLRAGGRARRHRARERVVTGVAIVGVGIHPFGRFEGVSGLDLGAHAVRQALADAGITWTDVQFAFGGSLAGSLAGSVESIQADQLVNVLGLTGVPFTNVHNGCATAGSTLAMGAAMIESGASDLGVCVGFDRHPRGHFNANPEQSGLPHWYGELGLMITTQYFAMKINRYMHDHGITAASLGRVAAKNYRNGARNPNAWRRKPWSEEEILESRVLNHPLTQYMFCSPDEGAAAVVLCRADRCAPVHGPPDPPARRGDAHAPLGFLRGVRAVDLARPGAQPDGRRRARLLRSGRRGSGRRGRRPAPGLRVGRGDHAHGGDGPVRRRGAGSDARGRRDRDRGSASREHRRWAHRQR